MYAARGRFGPVRVLAMLLVCCAIGTVGIVARQTDPAKEEVVLEGRVVNSETGQPVHAALVQFVGNKSRAVLTDSDGAFRFEGLMPGDGLLTVRKPGYLSPQEFRPQSMGQQRVHLVPNLPPVEIRLYPESVIFGRVTNENGRPLEGMTVLLRPAGSKHSTFRSSGLPGAVTNENGEYRFADLRAGAYLISVSPTLERPPLMTILQSSTKHSGYPTYFYPSVTDVSLATPVHLSPGKHFEADMRLTRQPLCRITGTVTGGSAEGQTLVFAVAEQSIQPAAGTSLMPGATDFALEGVPPGGYLLTAVQVGRNTGGGEKLGLSHVEVTQNVDSVSITLTEPQLVPVRFRYENAKTEAQAPAMPGMAGMPIVTLRQTDLPFGEEVNVASLTPTRENAEDGYPARMGQGTYRAKVANMPNRCVASVTSGGTELLKEDLVVPAGASIEPIEVAIRGDCGRVQGKVVKDGLPAMGRVLLIPEAMPTLGIATPANSDGGFELSGLLPGKYLTVALEDGDDLEPDDADTLPRVKSRAVPIDIGASSTTNVTLELKRLEP